MLDAPNTDNAPATAAPAPVAKPPTRWFLRCKDCCSVLAIEGKRPTVIHCACGGELETMGRVQRDRIVWDAARCPCDGRCTGANGPACDCSCGGENHGSGRVVKYTIDEGKAVIQPVDPSVMLARAAEFREVLASVNAAISYEASYYRAQRARGRVYKARQLKSHSGRVKALKSLLEDIKRGGAL